MATCAPVQFCSPPNWAIDFPDLVGATGVNGASGPTGPAGLDAPTELKATMFGPITELDIYVIDEGAWEQYQVFGGYFQLGIGSAVISVCIDGAPIPGLTSIAVDTTQRQYLVTASNTVSIGGKLSVRMESFILGTASLAMSLKTIQLGV